MIRKVDVPEGQVGDWRVSKFSVNKDVAVMSVFTDGPSRMVYPGTYTELTHRGHLVMSDTPAERHDHEEPVRRAIGSVLINGLGLGMVLQAVLDKPTVTDVTVIEIAPEVIQLVAPTYQHDPRLTIINDDAYTWQPPKGKRYNMVWHDIWPDLSLDNLPEMAKLHRKYGRRCDWQGSWGKEILLRERGRRGMRRWG